MLKVCIAVLLLLALPPSVYGDSVFDIAGTGKDVIPALGPTRSLAGAVGASTDPLTASIMAPFASAMAERVTLSAGFAHMQTRSKNFSEERRTITTTFPSLVVTIPLKRVSLLSGLFLEKEGRISLDYTGTYLNTIYDVTYRRESSIHSVPIYVSGRVHPRLVVSVGVIASFFDTRTKIDRDFRSDEFSDVEDVCDVYATGTGFACGFMLDLEKIRVSALYRTKSDLDGTVERSNEPIGIWSATDVSISSHDSFKFGLLLQPTRDFFLEIDYDKSPWEKIKIGQASVSDKSVSRTAIGAQYRGTRLWNARKYPLSAGYYRQPLDWQNEITGEITEDIIAVGTSIPLGEDRASVSLSFEYGWRESEHEASLNETVYGFSVSLSALETWRREIRR